MNGISFQPFLKSISKYFVIHDLVPKNATTACYQRHLTGKMVVL